MTMRWEYRETTWVPACPLCGGPLHGNRCAACQERMKRAVVERAHARAPLDDRERADSDRLLQQAFDEGVK